MQLNSDPNLIIVSRLFNKSGLSALHSNFVSISSITSFTARNLIFAGFLCCWERPLKLQTTKKLMLLVSESCFKWEVKRTF